MDFRALLNHEEYAFLHTSPHLGERIILLGVSGSYGYGTNCEGSDVDLRGVTLNLPSDLIGLTSYEQYEDKRTDTVIYAFTKAVRLFLNCNPNTIEILGLDDDQYLIKTDIGKELLDHRRMFLSRRAAGSFGHYANSQLQRLQNAFDRDRKDDKHRNKHAMHLVRLFMMGIDILKEAEIRTHRPEEDLKLLRSIRSGDYIKDHVMIPEFYEIVNEYRQRFCEAEEQCILPENPDMEAVEAFVEDVNRRVVYGEI